MSLLKGSEPAFMTADQAARRHGPGARSELVLRNAVEAFCRQRWPDARVVHELVMGERKVRADVVAIGLDSIAAFEIKGEYDDTTRLLHQVGMYQLCVPEVWMCVPVSRHAEDARLIRHLIPSVGLLVGAGTSAQNHYEFDGKDYGLTIEAESAPRPVVPAMMLEMLWRDELISVCNRRRAMICSVKTTRAHMIRRLLEFDVLTLQRETCTELRSRDAIWRADAPKTEANVQTPSKEQERP